MVAARGNLWPSLSNFMLRKGEEIRKLTMGAKTAKLKSRVKYEEIYK